MTELERMKRYGLTEAEVGRAKDKIIAVYEKAANSAETGKNSEFGSNPLINNFFGNYAYMEPATKLELVKAILAQLNAQVINQGPCTGFHRREQSRNHLQRS